MGAIPTQTIEQIAAANDIVDVIGSYFPLRRAGTSFKALCPFHQEKSPSFHVNPQRQTFHCFGCGVGGTVFRFVMDYEHVDFPAAVRKLGARVGITVVEENRPGGEDDRQHEARRTLLQLHSEAAEWFHDNLMKKDFAAPARDYLKRRGIDRVVAKSWQLGFAPPGWDHFLKWAQEQGYERRQILQSGLVKLRDEDKAQGDVYDRFRDRVMFPICNDVGEVIAFSGRILQKDTEAAKYINSPETPLFRKGNVLFGLHKTKRGLIEANCAIVCEGQLDLIALFEAGITNVVAPQGTAFTESQARVLKRFVNEVILCFDADAAGRKAAERSLDSLLQNDLIVRVAEMPTGEDPDSLIRREGVAGFEGRIREARDFFDYWIEHEATETNLNSLGAKMELARNLAKTVSRVRDPLMRGEVVRKVAARLGVPIAEFENLLEKAVRDWKTPERPAGGVEPLQIPQGIEHLCRLALRDSDFRDFLLSQEWKRVTSDEEWGRALELILEAPLDATKPSSFEAFLDSVDPELRPFYSRCLTEKHPFEKAPGRKGWVKPKVDNMRLGHELWHGLRQSALRRQLAVTESRMKAAQLSTGEVVNLQKQILDLTDQLHELSQFSPALSAEG